MKLSRFAWKHRFVVYRRSAFRKATADDFLWICGTRMYSHHLRIALSYKLVSQLVQAKFPEVNPLIDTNKVIIE